LIDAWNEERKAKLASDMLSIIVAKTLG